MSNSKSDFHSITSIADPPQKTRDDVIKEIMTCNDPEGLQRFMEQTDEKCMADMKQAMGQVNLTRRKMAELTGIPCNNNFYWQAGRLSRKEGYKKKVGTIYLNCLQNPHLFQELRDLTPVIKKVNFTEEQTQILTFHYNQNKRPSRPEREEIIALVNAVTPEIPRTEQSVLVWFANKKRKEAEEAKTVQAQADIAPNLLLTDFAVALSNLQSAANIATYNDSTASSSASLSPNEILATLCAALSASEAATFPIPFFLNFPTQK